MPGRLDGQPDDVLLADIGRESGAGQECLSLLHGQRDLTRTMPPLPQKSLGVELACGVAVGKNHAGVVGIVGVRHGLSMRGGRVAGRGYAVGTMSPNRRLPLGRYRKINSTQRADGRWRAFTRVRDLDGITRQVEATGASSASAIDALQGALAIRVPPPPEPGTAMTVESFANRWLERIRAEGRLSPGSITTYARAVDDRIIPGMGAWGIVERTPASVSRFLEREVVKVPGRAHTVRTTLKSILSFAITQGALRPPNPVDSAIPVRAAAPDARALTPEEMTTVLAAFRASRHSLLLTDALSLLLATGARTAELVALRPSDWKPKTRILEITGQVAVDGTPRRIEHPKSDAGFRKLTLPAWAAEVIDRRVADGGKWIFGTRNNTPITPANLRRAWRAALPEELSWVTPKSARKTVATLLGNANPEAAWRQLGHRDGATLKHYVERELPLSDNATALAALNPNGPALGSYWTGLKALAESHRLLALGDQPTSWDQRIHISAMNRKTSKPRFKDFLTDLEKFVATFPLANVSHVTWHDPLASVLAQAAGKPLAKHPHST